MEPLLSASPRRRRRTDATASRSRGAPITRLQRVPTTQGGRAPADAADR